MKSTGMLPRITVVACLAVSCGSLVTTRGFRVNPADVQMIPGEAAVSYLSAFLAKAIDEKDDREIACSMDDKEISCGNRRAPLADWRLLESMFTFSEHTGGISIFIATKDAYASLTGLPTGKGISLMLKVQDEAEATQVVSAFRSLGVTSFEEAGSKASECRNSGTREGVRIGRGEVRIREREVTAVDDLELNRDTSLLFGRKRCARILKGEKLRAYAVDRAVKPSHPMWLHVIYTPAGGEPLEGYVLLSKTDQAGSLEKELGYDE